ncbi:hypothetical protein F4809DRAFT_631241 [Biscogniauxia mediterranea]|nr:hypothetical protein F4809DRAFT_631241 [Biscogniauxia mediterranea]
MQIATGPPAHSSGDGSGPYPALPASPTLTNPDMILPDYDDTASSPDRSQSPRTLWKNSHPADMHFNLSQPFPTGPVTPTTPIIYGNGTMLSDIGEVTEVESSCAPRSRAASIRKDFPGRSFPTMTYEIAKKKESRTTRERRMSNESTSTITTNDHHGVFADFDDSVSVDDSNFQGDDEESVADSYIDETSVQESMSQAKELSNAFNEERYSTALSRRAEQILANAKRRLTTMEDNLNRARIYSPTMSVTSGSTPSPTFTRPTTAIHRDHDPDHSKGTHGHTRISSENNIVGEFKTDIFAQRSSSALGAAGGYRKPLQTLQGSRSADFMRETTPNNPQDNSIYGTLTFAKTRTSSRTRDQALEPLSEDDVSPGPSSRPSMEGARLGSFLSPTFGSFQDASLKRSASATQMRDLKDHMKDLKGRLSTLRDQARADSMKRRSLQSLRTPSPFTHARIEQWYVETTGPTNDQSTPDDPESQSANGDRSAVKDQDGSIEMTEEEIMESVGNGYENSDETPLVDMSPLDSRALSPDSNTTPTMSLGEEEEETDGMDGVDDMDDMRTEDGYEDDDTSDIYDSASESGESAYHDTVQNQVSHEDREDAFDYEHFFLHSAMGTMTQKRLNRRESQDSFSSEDSVETTRGPNTSSRSSVIKTGRRSRRGSAGSTSTMESFATATEGRHTRTDNNSRADEYWDQTEQRPERGQVDTPETPGTARRMNFASETSDSSSDRSQYRLSAVRRPQSSTATSKHCPSVSSPGSAGTNRSFPLVNNTSKVNGGVLTPRDSPDQELKQISETLMSETASICDRESIHGGETAAPINSLLKEDQILVERLVASLGRCVLGLTESGRASTESRLYRRRIDAARRILEGGLDEPAA